MPPAALESSFPLSITILSFVATGVLVVILLLLIVINSKLSMLCAKLSRPARAVKIEEKEEEPPVVEAAPGTHFEEFLNEDPERRQLNKKEQSKAYRAWRTKKGLNWSK
ncbi:MAG: hypothetical protein RLZZ505_3115 [Verrucomicrobiota bacterium]|jgi:hypothetical protein